jgi:hypothetical protein
MQQKALNKAKRKQEVTNSVVPKEAEYRRALRLYEADLQKATVHNLPDFN